MQMCAVPLLLRPRSFETTTFETTFILDLFIWDHFIWDHVRLIPAHLRSHSFYATLKWSCFDLLCITFLWSTFHFSAGDLKFCKGTIHLKFCTVTPFRVQGWLTLVCKCTRTFKHRRDQKTLHTSGLEGSVAPLKCHLDQVKELRSAFLPVLFIEVPE